MASIRQVSSLPLPRSVLDVLAKHGFRAVEDLAGLKPLELCQEVKTLTPAVALQVLTCAQKSMAPQSPEPSPIEGSVVEPDHPPTTAKDLLMKMGIHRPLITFCKEIDTMLGGGVMMGQLTEFCGVPGIGKTQLAIQLALDVQIPEVFNGNGGEAVYIDTEGSFLPERAAQMAAELSSHLQKLARAQQSRARNHEAALGQLAAAENMSTERFLEGISLIRCHDQAELLATLHTLPGLLRNKTRVKCIVLDSVAFHFRQDLQDLSTRNRLLSQLAQTLNQLAHDHKLAVVLVNHVTTKFLREPAGPRVSNNGGGGDEDAAIGWGDGAKRLVPALGEQWAHCITNRVLLCWQPGTTGPQRSATLLKSPAMPPKTVAFAVTARGVRDLPAPGPTQSSARV